MVGGGSYETFGRRTASACFAAPVGCVPGCGGDKREVFGSGLGRGYQVRRPCERDEAGREARSSLAFVLLLLLLCLILPRHAYAADTKWLGVINQQDIADEELELTHVGYLVGAYNATDAALYICGYDDETVGGLDLAARNRLSGEEGDFGELVALLTQITGPKGQLPWWLDGRYPQQIWTEMKNEGTTCKLWFVEVPKDAVGRARADAQKRIDGTGSGSGSSTDTGTGEFAQELVLRYAGNGTAAYGESIVLAFNDTAYEYYRDLLSSKQPSQILVVALANNEYAVCYTDVDTTLQRGSSGNVTGLYFSEQGHFYNINDRFSVKTSKDTGSVYLYVDTRSLTVWPHDVSGLSCYPGTDWIYYWFSGDEGTSTGGGSGGGSTVEDDPIEFPDPYTVPEPIVNVYDVDVTVDSTNVERLLNNILNDMRNLDRSTNDLVDLSAVISAINGVTAAINSLVLGGGTDVSGVEGLLSDILDGMGDLDSSSNDLVDLSTLESTATSILSSLSVLHDTDLSGVEGLLADILDDMSNLDRSTGDLVDLSGLVNVLGNIYGDTTDIGNALASWWTDEEGWWDGLTEQLYGIGDTLDDALSDLDSILSLMRSDRYVRRPYVRPTGPGGDFVILTDDLGVDALRDAITELMTKFPFSTINNLALILAALTRPAVTPVFDLPVLNPVTPSEPYLVHVDLSAWDTVAAIGRVGILLWVISKVSRSTVKIWTRED